MEEILKFIRRRFSANTYLWSTSQHRFIFRNTATARRTAAHASQKAWLRLRHLAHNTE